MKFSLFLIFLCLSPFFLCRGEGAATCRLNSRMICLREYRPRDPEGHTADFAHMNAHGEIPINPCHKIPDAGYLHGDFGFPDSDRFEFGLAKLLQVIHNKKLFFSRLVAIQARTSAIQASIALSALCWMMSTMV